MIQLNNIGKIYQTRAKSNVVALKNIDLEFKNNGLVFVLGASGSGKTTLLNLIGGLDQPTSGNIIIDDNLELGKDISFEFYRQNYVGFVFQEYNLLEDLNVFDNISLAVTYSDRVERSNAVKNILNDVALECYEKRKISELSGGQKQRVAIARALAQNSKVLLCDEPTGNLDSDTGKEIFDLLHRISKDKLVIVVSHNEEMATLYANRIVRIKDGNIQADTSNNETTNSNVKPIEFEHQNKVSLVYKLKCGFTNLFVQKFKTSIAFLLVFLSIFSMCLMQVCLSYNSEQSIAKTLSNDSSIIILKNNSRNNDSVLTISEEFPLQDNLNTYMSISNYANGYRVSNDTFFILDNTNSSIIDSKEFYFKNDLSDGFAYVSDYFVDLVVNSDENYSGLTFEEYAQLNDAEVIYKGHLQFKIAGIIKTDYKDYYDERGNVKTKDESSYLTFPLGYKLNYQYRAIYTTNDTFEKMFLDSYSSYYSRNEDYSIKVQETSYSTKVSNVQVYDIHRSNPSFYLPSGYFGMCELVETSQSTIKRRITDDEIVINGALYNKIFGTNINWDDFYGQYYNAIYNGLPMENSLPHLNKRLTVTIENSDGKVLEIRDKKVIGVSTNFTWGRDDLYFVYGTREGVGLTNKLLSTHYVSELNWQKISNKTFLLRTLRRNSILVTGTKANLIYEKEYIVSQMSYFFMAVAGVISLIALISIFNLANAKIRDKKREIGILLAIGLKKSEVNFIFMLSIIIIMVLSALITIGLLYLTLYIINTLLIIEPFGFISYFNASWLTYVVIILTCILMCVISMIPLVRITNQEPVDIITN